MKAIVIAADPERAQFVCETLDGVAAVFFQQEGPLVQVGDIVDGAVRDRGAQILDHAEGPCAVFGATGPLTRDEALTWARDAKDW